MNGRQEPTVESEHLIQMRQACERVLKIIGVAHPLEDYLMTVPALGYTGTKRRENPTDPDALALYQCVKELRGTRLNTESLPLDNPNRVLRNGRTVAEVRSAGNAIVEIVEKILSFADKPATSSIVSGIPKLASLIAEIRRRSI